MPHGAINLLIDVVNRSKQQINLFTNLMGFLYLALLVML